MPRAANLVMATGEHDFETARRTGQPLLLIHDLEGGGTDPRSGHLSLVVSDGEWWDGRHCVGPVAGLHLEGNVVTILAAVDRVCADRTGDSGAATCGREGEGVPIAFLTPSIRTRGLQQLQRKTGVA